MLMKLNHLYGTKFNVIADLIALLSIKKEDRSNKSYKRRLTSCLDRLLPYQFTIENLQGAKTAFVDYLPRHTHQKV